MSSEYSYDEQGQFFPYFVLTLTALVTVPLTWTVVFPSQPKEALAPRITTSFRPDDADQVQSILAAEKRKLRRTRRLIVVLCGWALIAFMIYLIMGTKLVVPVIWNPYDILGISDSSTARELKKRYNRLALLYHPDKAKPDPGKNETVESVTALYVEIVKAYQALTNEDVRNNYIKYGHPDGKQSFSIGIALPKFIVADGNGKYVVMVYTILLGVLLPYTVGSWWYGTKRVSREGVLMESANSLFQEYDDAIDGGGIITALSVGKELKDLVNNSPSGPALAKLESNFATTVSGLSAKTVVKYKSLEDRKRKKAVALLWAYLQRSELDDVALNRLKLEAGPVAYDLNRSFGAVALAYGSTTPILASYALGQQLIQAIPPDGSPLLQLPFFTPAVVEAIEGVGSKLHMTVQQFMSLDESQRRSLAVGAGLLTESQYGEAVAVAKQLPRLEIVKAFFKVTGERCIIPSSLVTLVVKGRFVPPGSQNVPAVLEADLEDLDAAEDDLDALSGRKKKTVRGPDGKPVTQDEAPVTPHLAFAPRFARDKAPAWHVFLTDSKLGKMNVPPFTYAKWENPAFGPDGRPTFYIQTFKAQFAAPPQPGNYTFVMHVICDSYLGLDAKVEVTLVVEEASKAAEMTADDDISEPDEDSLAGQMHALKSGSVPGTTRSRRKAESDDESGTDEDAETSETNTDTDEEA